jgi:cytochrome b6
VGKCKGVAVLMWTWLEERYSLSGLALWLKAKTVPIHRYTFAYGLGSPLALLFGISCVTGILLGLHYVPAVSAAHESVVSISTEVPFGSFIRALHRWSAHLSIAIAFVHLLLKWLLRAYRRPREMTWITGCLLLACWLAAGFTGYLLPWDVLSVTATKVGTQMAALVPVFGKSLLILLRGGADVTEGTLPRFFIFHVALIPAGMLLLLGAHLGMIQAQGMSVPLSVEKDWARERKSYPFFPDFLLREGIVWLCMLGLLSTVAVLFPPELRGKADLLAPAATGIKPEWYFLFLYQTLKLVPARLLFVPGDVLFVLATALAGLLLLALPFLDRRSSRGQPNRAVTILAVAAVFYFVVMTAWALVPMPASGPVTPTQASSVQTAGTEFAHSSGPVVTKAGSGQIVWLILTWMVTLFLIAILAIRIRDLNRLRRMGL